MKTYSPRFNAGWVNDKVNMPLKIIYKFIVLSFQMQVLVMISLVYDVSQVMNASIKLLECLGKKVSNASPYTDLNNQMKV